MVIGIVGMSGGDYGDWNRNGRATGITILVIGYGDHDTMAIDIVGMSGGDYDSGD